jgi:hypothetical protein
MRDRAFVLATSRFRNSTGKELVCTVRHGNILPDSSFFLGLSAPPPRIFYSRNRFRLGTSGERCRFSTPRAKVSLPSYRTAATRALYFDGRCTLRRCFPLIQRSQALCGGLRQLQNVPGGPGRPGHSTSSLGPTTSPFPLSSHLHHTRSFLAPKSGRNRPEHYTVHA